MHAKIVVLFVGLATIRCLLGDSVHGFPVCKLQISIDHMFFSQELLWRITKKQPSCAGDITHESTVRDVLEHFQGGKNHDHRAWGTFGRGPPAVSAGRKHIAYIQICINMYIKYTVRKLQDDVYTCVWLNICL